MLKVTILFCAVLVVAAENIVDVTPDISVLQEKFNVAKEHYQHLDDTNLLKSIQELMKKVNADVDSIDRKSNAYFGNHCNIYVDRVFDLNEILSSIGQCRVGNLKQRYIHIWSIFDRLKSDIIDINTITKDHPSCGDDECAVYIADTDAINNMYNAVLPAKVDALKFLLDAFANSINLCQISRYPDLQQQAATFLEKTQKCIAGVPGSVPVFIPVLNDTFSSNE